MNWIKDKLKRSWKWLTALFVSGVVIAQVVGFPPPENNFQLANNGTLRKIVKDVEYCYTNIKSNATSEEILILLDCETYHWLGAGPGARKPFIPNGYTWQWSGASVNGPMEGEYIIDNDYVYIGVKNGEKRLRLDRKIYTVDETNGLTILPDPILFIIKNGQLQKQ